MKELLILSFIMLCCCYGCAERKNITIHMIGDSTMANKPLEKNNQERGWGQVLNLFLDTLVSVDNQAVNGRSSKSFITEGRWQTVVNSLSPGDYVFIQFGHNDEKPDSLRHTIPGSTFDENLRLFCKETIEKGARPVLFNSIVRRNFSQDSILLDTHGEYRNVPRSVAREFGIPFVDANQMTHELVALLGLEKSKTIYMWIAPGVSDSCPDGREDNTHLNIKGARIIAALLVNAIADSVPELKSYISNSAVQKELNEIRYTND